MSEVRATLSGDSSSYVSAFDKARAAHEAFFEGERRVEMSMQNVSREMINAKDPIEALVGSLSHLTRIFGDEFAMGAAGTVAILGTVIYKMYEASEFTRKLKEDVAGLDTTFKYGPKMENENASSSFLESKAQAAQQIIEKQVQTLEDPSMVARLNRGWGRVLTGPVGGGYDAQQEEIARKAAEDQQEKYGEMAKRQDVKTGLDLEQAQVRYQGPVAKAEVEKKQLDFEYQDKMDAAAGKLDFAQADALARELAVKKQIIDLDTQHAGKVEAEDTRHNEVEAGLIKMRADGDTERAKKAEVVETSQHGANLRVLAGTPDEGMADILNAQVAANQEIYDLATDHLDAETKIAQIAGPRGERAVQQVQAEVAELQRQRDLQMDKNAWMEKNLELQKAQTALQDQANAREEAIQEMRSQGAYLDVQYRQQMGGYVGGPTEEQKVELANVKLADLERKLTSPEVAGDPNKELQIENQMRQLRNEIAQPINRLDFGGTTQLAVGGGLRGSGGDPLLAETQAQTTFLQSIDANIADLNRKLGGSRASSSGSNQWASLTMQ